MPYFTALATDLDGTLTSGDRLDAAAIAHLDHLRDEGIATVLVTGRISSEMRTDFSDLDRHFDAIVSENGAVVTVSGVAVACSAPVHPRLCEALADSRVSYRQGESILACGVHDAARVADAIAAQGLDEQVVRNRSELMVVPAGCSKASGLRVALAELGLSPHNCVSVGDAENDLSMLAACEVGAAVHTSVASVLGQADVRLAAGGSGVSELARRVLADSGLAIPARHAQRVGTTADGLVVTVPGARARLLVCGDSGTGKSFLAGLLVERWIVDGYKVLVIDPEGEHVELGRYHQAAVFDGSAGWSDGDLGEAMRDPYRPVIVDLSSLTADERSIRIASVMETASSRFATHSFPHWIMVDEAQDLLGDRTPQSDRLATFGGGLCLVTYRPDQLRPTLRSTVDATLTTFGGADRCAPAAFTASIADDDSGGVVFTVDRRQTAHTRHRRKYASTQLSPDDRFTFRRTSGAATGTASSLEQFVDLLADADDDVVQRHVEGGDFSRWVAQSIRDRELSVLVASAERTCSDAIHAQVDVARDAIASAFIDRYFRGPGMAPDQSPPPPAPPPTPTT